MEKMITSLEHPLVKHLVKLRTNRSYRTSEKKVLIVGENLVKEVKVNRLFTREDFSDRVMKKITGLEHPDGFAAEVNMPTEALFDSIKSLLVLDGVNDPGNMGTLIRTALALGWEGVFITPNSCDPFNDKALRASKGGIFRLPFATGSFDDLRIIMTKNKLTPLAATIGGSSLQDLAPPSKVALVLGNEARGISEEAKKGCQKISIPMQGDMESLNVAVAGAILMYCLQPHFQG